MYTFSPNYSEGEAEGLHKQHGEKSPVYSNESIKTIHSDRMLHLICNFILFLMLCLTMQLWLSWNSIFRPGWPCLCFANARKKRHTPHPDISAKTKKKKKKPKIFHFCFSPYPPKSSKIPSTWVTICQSILKPVESTNIKSLSETVPLPTITSRNWAKTVKCTTVITSIH